MEIAIISGKGGTGKSSITAALASIAKSVVLADCDVDAANMHLIMNPSVEEETTYIAGEKAVIDYSKCNSCRICMEYCRFEAISLSENKVSIDSVNCDGCRLCERVCPLAAICMEKNDKSRMYSGTFRFGKMVFGILYPGEENSGKLVAIVRRKAKEIASLNKIDHILIDSPPGIGCSLISSITGVDKVVIVTEPSMSAFSDLVRTVELVSKFNTELSVVINKSDLCQQITNEIIAYCKQNNFKISGTIQFDPEVVYAMVNCMTINEWRPDSETSNTLKQIYNSIIN